MRTVKYAFAALLFASSMAMAQGQNMREEMRKKMEEISKLMRESERLLLEITRIDRLVERQADIVRKLKELEQPNKPPPPAGSAAAKERQEKIEDLKKKQAEAMEKLGKLFDGQKKRGEGAARELQNLLKNWPKKKNGGQQSDPQKDKKKKQKQRDQRDKKDELKNRSEQPDQPRDKKDLFKKKPERGKKPPDKKQAARIRSQIEAWITRLPPDQLERINRGDLSFIPQRYRRLVREYTARRAKREAESGK